MMEMRESDADTAALQKHISGTYFALRRGMGVLAAALPPLLWLGGRFIDHEPLRCSMSAYYYSPAMRNTFVGALVAIGAFLYLYQGFSRQENWALNFAGACAVGIAMFPTDQRCEEGGMTLTLHGTFAVLFFLSVAYVSVFRASDTLSLIRDTHKAEQLHTTYRLLGGVMILSPLIATALTVVLQPSGHPRSILFFIESVAVFTFAAYWLIKSRELSATDAERLALERKLQPVAHPSTAEGAPGRLVQTEPDDTEVRS